MTVKRFFSTLFINIGALIVIFSGGCTLYSILISAKNEGLNGEWVLLCLIVGGIPFLLGLGSYYIGKKIRKNETEKH